MNSLSMPIVWVPPGAPVWVPDEFRRRAEPTRVPVKLEPEPESDGETASYAEPESRLAEAGERRKAAPDQSRWHQAVAEFLVEPEVLKPDPRKDFPPAWWEEGADWLGSGKRKPGKGAPQRRGAKEKKGEDDAPAPGPSRALFALIQKALQRWNLKAKEMVVAASKPEWGSAIWRLRTSSGPKGFKLLHRSPRRCLFSIAAQEYLVSRGAKVPPLVKARDGKPYALVGGRMFTMTEWIDELVTAPEDAEGAAALCYGLGEFHRLSRGFRPPEHAMYATRLERWPYTFARLRAKMAWFEELARAYPKMPASAAMLKAVRLYREQADQAIERLAKSAYDKLTARGEENWGLAHQDYGWGNGLLGPGGVWVIDLDGVRFDLPVRDLRKMITTSMIDLPQWDLGWIKGMIKAYQDAHPIEEGLFDLMLIELSLPHEFYHTVKNVIYDPALMDREMNTALQLLLEADDSKWRALRALGLRRR